jgi:D-glycero-alpha-D-manno-heptose-7-phosphate kinase
MRLQKTCTYQAPTRVDIAGGTLDIWPLAAILQEKEDLWQWPVRTVNVAISLYAKACVSLIQSEQNGWLFEDKTTKRREECSQLSGNSGASFPLHRSVSRWFESQGFSSKEKHQIQVSTDAMAPRGSGLGGSSSVVMALLACFSELSGSEQIKTAHLCETAKNLEAGILGGLAGNQDHFAATFGGVQAVCHSAQGSVSQPLACKGNELVEHMVLAHSGQEHFSVFNNWLILEKALTGDKNLLGKCKSIAQIAHEICDPLQQNDFQAVAKLCLKEWEFRRTLADGITTNRLENLHAAALTAGSWGGKVCGAGGGGVLVMFAEPGIQRKRVEDAIVAGGGVLLPAQFDAYGLTRIG